MGRKWGYAIKLNDVLWAGRRWRRAFLDAYMFAGNRGAIVKQIGKAVPPHTAKSLILEALRMLLIFASVMHDLIASTLKVAWFKRIELGFSLADFADKDLEVGRLRHMPDERGKSEFLGWHRIPPTASIANVHSFVGISWMGKGCGITLPKAKSSSNRLEICLSRRRLK